MAEVIFIEQRPTMGTRHAPWAGATIGRADCDFTLHDPDVSRTHAVLRGRGTAIAIEDLGSKNGTFVNGRRITGPTELKDGDEVRFGSTVWRVEAAPAPAPPPQAAAGPADETIVSARPAPPSATLAGFAPRLFAALIDLLVVAGPVTALSLALGSAGFAIGWVAAPAYFVLAEGGRRGQTAGKRAVGIRVTGAQSAALGPARAGVRFLGRILSALPLFAGYLWMLRDEHRQTWHDKLSRSLVRTAEQNRPGS